MGSEKQKLTNRNQLCPIFASVSWKYEDETNEQSLMWFAELRNLSLVTRFGLSSEGVIEEIKKTVEKFNIATNEKAGEVSRLVREKFTREISEEEVKKRAVEKLEIDESQVGNFLEDYKRIIEVVNESGQQIFKEEVEQLPILEALKKYKEVGEQWITGGRIFLDAPAEPVDPSVKHWLEDYIQQKGAESHNNLERSDFLYRSRNVGDLAEEEVSKISEVLESYDQETLLMIDRNSGEIIFGSRKKDKMGGKPSKNVVALRDKTVEGRSLVQELSSPGVVTPSTEKIASDNSNVGKLSIEYSGGFNNKIDSNKKQEQQKEISAIGDIAKNNGQSKVVELEKKEEKKPDFKNVLDLKDFEK